MPEPGFENMIFQCQRPHGVPPIALAVKIAMIGGKKHNEHYHNGMTNYHGGAEGFLNGIPTVPFHLRNFDINSGQHEPIPKDNAVLD